MQKLNCLVSPYLSTTYPELSSSGALTQIPKPKNNSHFNRLSCKIAFRIWKSVRARLQSCRKRPIPIPALAAAELQTIENKKTQGLKPNIFLLN
jgi:hypothetical protein